MAKPPTWMTIIKQEHLPSSEGNTAKIMLTLKINKWHPLFWIEIYKSVGFNKFNLFMWAKLVRSVWSKF